MGTVISRWCTYAKRKLISCKSVSTYKVDDKNLPEMMILESEKYADGDNLSTLETLEKERRNYCFRLSGKRKGIFRITRL